MSNQEVTLFNRIKNFMKYRVRFKVKYGDIIGFAPPPIFPIKRYVYLSIDCVEKYIIIEYFDHDTGKFVVGKINNVSSYYRNAPAFDVLYRAIHSYKEFPWMKSMRADFYKTCQICNDLKNLKQDSVGIYVCNKCNDLESKVFADEIGSD